MKKIIYRLGFFTTILFLNSCVTTSAPKSMVIAKYTPEYAPVEKQKIILSEANFNFLGAFSGTVIKKYVTPSIENDQGLIAMAKQTMLTNAKKRGVELTGSRVLTNISIDIVRNNSSIATTFCADIIEFKK